MENMPPIAMSKCLSGAVCRYHGKRVGRCTKLISGLEKKGHRVIFLCPEMLGGLTVPRPPARWFKGVLYSGGRDVTENFYKGAALVLKACQEAGVRIFYGVKGSPACGWDGVASRLLRENGILVEEIWR